MKDAGGKSKILDQLQDYLKQGYLLHGSKEKLSVVEPRQASDNDPDRKTGKAFAVYAEAHDIRIPILMALFSEKDPSKRSWSSSYSVTGNEPMKVTGVNCTFSSGYVYVLPKDSFTKEGGANDFEYISLSPVTPTEVFEVDPSILSELHDIEFAFKD
jgi:hypothetical protein